MTSDSFTKRNKNFKATNSKDLQKLTARRKFIQYMRKSAVKLRRKRRTYSQHQNFLPQCLMSNA